MLYSVQIFKVLCRFAKYPGIVLLILLTDLGSCCVVPPTPLFFLRQVAIAIEDLESEACWSSEGICSAVASQAFLRAS